MPVTTHEICVEAYSRLKDDAEKPLLAHEIRNETQVMQPFSPQALASCSFFPLAFRSAPASLAKASVPATPEDPYFLDR